jgi:polysaccharide biosynthesis protein PelG
VYFSLLSIVPGLAVFLLKLETGFAASTEAFYRAVLHKGTLGQIEALRTEMIERLREGFVLLLKVQGLCTLMLLLAAPQFLTLTRLGHVQMGVFQICLLGAFLLVVLLALLMVLHYLDKRRDALMVCSVFALVNLAATGGSILAGERWYGFGFLVGAGAAAFLAAWRVNSHLERLEYDTFTSQPLYG